MRFTDYYAASGVCTPSRASLMTGCYPRRVSMHVDEHGTAVLRPVSTKGLHPGEVTIAEVLKACGYATCCIGKWHLGDQPPFLPTRQGFDEYLGIPYSDDMTQRPGKPWPPLPLMRNDRVIEAPADRTTLTKRYTEASIAFIRRNRDRPFFLYLAHAMPGSTRRPFASPAFRGRSANGPWGDAVEEIDWSTGQILAVLAELGIAGETLVVWTSDNGAPRRDPPQGSNAPLAGWGYATREGGMRVPCIMRWPGRIPAGRTCRALATTMDLLPTFAALAGARVPEGRVIDGHDIRALISGKPGAATPYEAFYYYHQEELQAVRSGDWKLYLASSKGDRAAEGVRLYDLARDLAEQRNLAAERPDVVRRLVGHAEAARRDLGDRGRPGSRVRPAGFVESPQPRVKRTGNNYRAGR
jgi:arylsulfatase A-like enzyme